MYGVYVVERYCTLAREKLLCVFCVLLKIVTAVDHIYAALRNLEGERERERDMQCNSSRNGF